MLIFLALNLVDIVTTTIGLSNGASDLNPLFHIQGFQNFLLTKLAISIIAIPIYTVAYHFLKARFPKYVKVVWASIGFVIGFYSFIVVRNLIVLWLR